MTMVVVTRMQANGPRSLKAAMGLTGMVARELVVQPGFLSGRLRVDRRQAMWTITVWEDARSLEAFRALHAPVAARGPELASALESTGWHQNGAAVPTWRQVSRRWMTVVPPALGLNRPLSAKKAAVPAG